MKSRWTTYLLLLVVAAVWGVVIWKIFFPKSEPVSAAKQTPSAAPLAAEEPDTLCCNYPDPFLKGARPSSAIARPVVRALPATQPPAHREPIRLTHLGTIVSAGRTLYILTLGEDQHELHRGESADDFTLKACDGDSLYLEKNGVRYGVKLCE